MTAGLPPGLAEALAAALGSDVTAARPVYGGDVATSFRLDLADGRTVFAKTHRDPPPGFFTTEAAGLGWLGEPGVVAVPEVLAVSDEPPTFLALGWIEEGQERSGTDAELGRALAALHGAGAPCFGRADRRTTGSRRLPNEPTDTWAEFYADNRLRPLARLANGVLAPEVVAGLERIADRLGDLGGPAEPPARLHGDLWAGNRLIGADGSSWLIDPAAHGGHREFDLAMMRLFGGFGEACFAAYEEVAPLADGWRERVSLHQLAPLVVHAVKFGGGYVGAATRAVERYA